LICSDSSSVLFEGVVLLSDEVLLDFVEFFEEFFLVVVFFVLFYDKD